MSTKPVVHDGLRLGLLSAMNRTQDALLTISAVSGVQKDKIRRFVDGDDTAISATERTILETLM